MRIFNKNCSEQTSNAGTEEQDAVRLLRRIGRRPSRKAKLPGGWCRIPAKTIAAVLFIKRIMPIAIS